MTTLSMPQQGAIDQPLAASASWLRFGSLLTSLYVLFALVLVGVPGLSRGGIAVALLAGVWTVLGLITRQARFPMALLPAVIFYFYIVLSGLMRDAYPFEYIGQVTTIWVGSISIAIFMANGMSIRVVLWGFLVVFVTNMIAIAVGYDGFQINVAGTASGLGDSSTLELDRLSGLAGHPNGLAALVVAPLFLMFLRHRGIGGLTFVALFAAGLTTSILTGSRAGLAATVLFAVCASFFLMQNRWLRRLAMLIMAAIAVGALFFSMDPNALTKIERSSLGEVVIVKRIILSIDGVDNSEIVRKSLAKSAWEPFLNKPFSGHGPNTFQDIVGGGTYAHNTIAEIAVNFGLIGLGLWVGMYVVAVMGVVRSPYKMPALGVLAFLALMDQSYVAYIDRALALTMCLTLAFCGRSLYRRARRSTPVRIVTG